eukprot:4246512-Pleurochrysis_carterae.AAC.2
MCIRDRTRAASPSGACALVRAAGLGPQRRGLTVRAGMGSAGRRAGDRVVGPVRWRRRRRC